MDAKRWAPSTESLSLLIYTKKSDSFCYNPLHLRDFLEFSERPEDDLLTVPNP